MPKLLGIDLGKKRTGIAATDDLQIIASGLCSIPTKELFKWLDEYCNNHTIETIVFGLPKDLNNLDTDATSFVNTTLEKVKRKLPHIQIKTVDERFTSKIAKKSIFDSGIRKSKRRDKGLIDEVSAVLILQSYMSQRL